MTVSNHCSQSLKLQLCQKTGLPAIVAPRECPGLRLLILPVMERALFSGNSKGVLKRERLPHYKGEMQKKI